MRNAKTCGCSFSQDRDASSCAGERIRVNQSCNRCEQEERGRESRCECQNSCRPRPCPRPCPQPQPCPPRPCPSCEERCASQYRNCMRNCRWDDDCDCKGHRPNFEFEQEECGCRGKRSSREREFEQCDCDHEEK